MLPCTSTLFLSAHSVEDAEYFCDWAHMYWKLISISYKEQQTEY
jgi:hypothetical protein